jgi:hypothetical protein
VDGPRWRLRVARSRSPPTRGAGAFGAALTAPTLFYNDLPLHLSGIFGQAVTPTAGAWPYTPTSLTPGAFDYFTYQFGDDVTGDYFQACSTAT